MAQQLCATLEMVCMHGMHNIYAVYMIAKLITDDRIYPVICQNFSFRRSTLNTEYTGCISYACFGRVVPTSSGVECGVICSGVYL